MRRSLLFSFAVGVMATLAPLVAHHAVGEVYDETRTVRLEGEIVALVYRNPHSILHVDVADQRGTQHTWAVEWRAAKRLISYGVGPRTLRPGDRVIVCGNPGWDPSQYRLLLLSLTRPSDGWSTSSPSCDGA